MDVHSVLPMENLLYSITFVTQFIKFTDALLITPIVDLETYALMLGILTIETKLLDAVLYWYWVVCALHRIRPLDDTSPIHSVCASCLPSAASLPNLLAPHAFLLAKHILVVPVSRIKQVRKAGDSQAPGCVQRPTLIHDDIQHPCAPQLL